MKSSLYPLLLLLLAVTIAGCSAASGQDQEAYQRGYDAALLAYQNFGLSSPDDGPAPTPKPGDVCPDCNGSGQVGDGRVFQKCLECAGTGKVQLVRLPKDSLAQPVILLPPGMDEMHEDHGEMRGRRRGLFRRIRARRQSSGMMHDDHGTMETTATFCAT